MGKKPEPFQKMPEERAEEDRTEKPSSQGQDMAEQELKGLDPGKELSSKTKYPKVLETSLRMASI